MINVDILRARLAELDTELRSINTEAGDAALTDDQQTRWDSSFTERDQVLADIDAAEKAEAPAAKKTPKIKLKLTTSSSAASAAHGGGAGDGEGEAGEAAAGDDMDVETAASRAAIAASNARQRVAEEKLKKEAAQAAALMQRALESSYPTYEYASASPAVAAAAPLHAARAPSSSSFSALGRPRGILQIAHLAAPRP